jgi:nitronate monooxygenase
LSSLEVPVVQAPMAGGPSAPYLAAAVNRAGGLGFLAGGYQSAGQLASDITTLRAAGIGACGVNLFVSGGHPADQAEVAAYAARLTGMADAAGVRLGEPRFDDDAFRDKVSVLYEERPAVVSFTFGLPPDDVVGALQEAGSEVWLTVTSAAEAVAAAELGADALIVQGVEAGGHRGVFGDDDEQSDLTVLVALQLIGAAVDVPLVAAGGIMTGAALAAVLAAGAAAGQVGTAYLRSTEAGTSQVHRDAVASGRPTVLTRAFSGRTARGVGNRWHEQYGQSAPRAYPEVHYLTAPLRAHGRQAGDPDLVNLWAGQAHSLAQAESAEEITRSLARDARAALADAAARLGAD